MFSSCGVLINIKHVGCKEMEKLEGIVYCGLHLCAHVHAYVHVYVCIHVLMCKPVNYCYLLN